MTGSDSAREVVICRSCRADEMGCQVKLGLGGRLCCSDCSHVELRKRTRGDATSFFLCGTTVNPTD